MYDEATVKVKVESAINLLKGILDDLSGVEAVIATPFGHYRKNAETGKRERVEMRDGVWVPVEVAPDTEPEPEPKPVVWPEAGLTCNDFTFSGTEAYAQYIRKHMKTCCDAKAGAAGLVAECRAYWEKRDTFYEPIKAFIAQWPQYFPCVEC